MVQVVIFGAVLTFGGYDKAEAKILQGRSLLNLVLSVDNALLCMFQRVWTYFQDIGVLIFGGRARKMRAHSRILRLEREVLRPENLVQSQLCA